jgi:hypothetical protein
LSVLGAGVVFASLDDEGEAALSDPLAEGAGVVDAGALLSFFPP